MLSSSSSISDDRHSNSDYKLLLSDDYSVDDSNPVSTTHSHTSDSDSTSSKTTGVGRKSILPTSIDDDGTSSSTSRTSASQSSASVSTPPLSNKAGNLKTNTKELTKVLKTITKDINEKASTDTIIKRCPATLIGVIGLSMIVVAVAIGIFATGGAIFPIVLTMLVLGSIMAATAINIGHYHSEMKNDAYATLADPFDRLGKKTDDLKDILKDDSLDETEKRRKYLEIKKEINSLKSEIRTALETFKKNEYAEAGKISELSTSINKSNLQKALTELEKTLQEATKKAGSSSAKKKQPKSSSSSSQSTAGSATPPLTKSMGKKPSPTTSTPKVINPQTMTSTLIFDSESDDDTVTATDSGEGSIDDIPKVDPNPFILPNDT